MLWQNSPPPSVQTAFFVSADRAAGCRAWLSPSKRSTRGPRIRLPTSGFRPPNRGRRARPRACLNTPCYTGGHGCRAADPSGGRGFAGAAPTPSGASGPRKWFPSRRLVGCLETPPLLPVGSGSAAPGAQGPQLKVFGKRTSPQPKIGSRPGGPRSRAASRSRAWALSLSPFRSAPRNSAKAALTKGAAKEVPV